MTFLNKLKEFSKTFKLSIINSFICFNLNENLKVNKTVKDINSLISNYIFNKLRDYLYYKEKEFFL